MRLSDIARSSVPSHDQELLISPKRLKNIGFSFGTQRARLVLVQLNAACTSKEVWPSVGIGQPCSARLELKGFVAWNEVASRASLTEKEVGRCSSISVFDRYAILFGDGGSRDVHGPWFCDARSGNGANQEHFGNFNEKHSIVLNSVVNVSNMRI